MASISDTAVSRPREAIVLLWKYPGNIFQSIKTYVAEVFVTKRSQNVPRGNVNHKRSGNISTYTFSQCFHRNVPGTFLK